ncbi:MAG: NADH-quinone oxidoreductase subunit C [Candidatus Asgardarchaeia archaeon]
MNYEDDEVYQALKEKFADIIEEVKEKPMLTFYIKYDGKDKLKEVARVISQKIGLSYGETCSAVDYPKESYFDVFWFIWSFDKKKMYALRIKVPYSSPKVPSLTEVWPSLNWHERETHEMFGIEFEGHPNLAPLILEDYEDIPEYPLRKSVVLEKRKTRHI